MIRLTCLLVPRPGVAADAVFAVLRDRVGPAVAGAQADLGLIRYVQLHADADAGEADALARSLRGTPASPAVAMADFWWADSDALDAACSGQGLAQLQAIALAGAQVLDPERSCCWLTAEFPQVQPGTARVVARPRTPLLKLAFLLRPAPGLAEAAARDYWLTHHGPLIRSFAAARGMVAYQQVHRRDDPARLSRVAEALGLSPGTFMGHAEAWFDRSSPRVGADIEEAKTRAIADERRFIDLARSVLFSGKEYPFVDRDWAL